MNKSYKVKGVEVDSQKTSTHYGIDAENELSKLLSEELAKSIDAPILQTLSTLGKPMKRSEKIKSVLNKIKSSE